MDVQSEWEWLFQVTLIDATNLPTVHWRNQVLPGKWINMDPFCVFGMNRNERAVAVSTVCEGGDINPKWNEEFDIRVHDGIASVAGANILVCIAHHDRNATNYHRLIGTARISLSEFPLNDSPSGLPGQWRQIQLNVDPACSAFGEKTQGKLNVNLQKRQVPVRVASPSRSSAGGIKEVNIGGLTVGLEMARFVSL